MEHVLGYPEQGFSKNQYSQSNFFGKGLKTFLENNTVVPFPLFLRCLATKQCGFSIHCSTLYGGTLLNTLFYNNYFYSNQYEIN